MKRLIEWFRRWGERRELRRKELRRQELAAKLESELRDVEQRLNYWQCQIEYLEPGSAGGDAVSTVIRNLRARRAHLAEVLEALESGDE